MNMFNILICRFAKLYSVMIDSKNVNVQFMAKRAQSNLHGPLGRNFIFLQIAKGIDLGKMDTNSSRKILENENFESSNYIIAKQITELSDIRDLQTNIPGFHSHEITEMIDYLCTT